VVAPIRSDRRAVLLPCLRNGAAASTGGGLAKLQLPAGVKTVLLAQVAKGFDDTFWLMAGMTLLCFPMALLLRRPLRPAAVRAFGFRQLTEGVILGAAARRVGANGSPAHGHGLRPGVASPRPHQAPARAARGAP